MPFTSIGIPIIKVRRSDDRLIFIIESPYLKIWSLYWNGAQVTRSHSASPGGQWVNLLWPSDAISRHRPGSTLAQVMAWCLTAPSHYLNQCWLIVSKVQWHSSEGNFTKDTSATNCWISLKYSLFKISFKSPRANELKYQRLYTNSDQAKPCWIVIYFMTL